MQQEIADGAVESSANRNRRYVVATFQNSGSHPRQRETDGRDPQKEEVYLIPAFLEIPNQAQMAPTRKSCLEAGRFSVRPGYQKISLRK